MPVDLPKPIAAYFAADTKDADAVARCFAGHAVVKDEGRTHAGREAIRRWRTEAAAKYDYVSEPIDVARDGARYVVTSRVSGTFPGSPVELRYAFVLEGDAIAGLEIAP